MAGVLIIFLENDYYQGISFKIMFIHVPAAWLSLMIFFSMGISSIIGLIFKSPTSFTISRSLSPIGLIMSIVVLITGSIWGNLTWGTYWVWDARLTSMLILAFIYLGHLFLLYSFEHFQKADLQIGVQVFDESFFFPMSSIPYAVRVFRAEEVVSASSDSMVPGSALPSASMTSGLIVDSNTLYVHSGMNTVGINLNPDNAAFHVDVGGLLNAHNLRLNGIPILQTFS